MFSCYLAIGEVEKATLQYMKCLQSGSDVCVDRKLLVEASEGLEKAQVFDVFSFRMFMLFFFIVF